MGGVADAIKNPTRLAALEAPRDARGRGVGGIQFRTQDKSHRLRVIKETDNERLASGAHRMDNLETLTGILVLVPQVGTLELLGVR